jgi:hypothetical protein
VEKDVETVVTPCEEIFRNFAGGTEKNHKKLMTPMPGTYFKPQTSHCKAGVLPISATIFGT